MFWRAGALPCCEQGGAGLRQTPGCAGRRKGSQLRLSREAGELAMRIAVAANGPELDAQVSRRLGLCSHLLLVDTETMAFEAVPVPPVTVGPGAGIRTVTLALANEAQVIIAGYAPPNIVTTLRENGIEVVISGTVSARQAVEQYVAGTLGRLEQEKAGGGRAARSLRTSARQFASVLPVLLGVIMVVGLFKTFVTREVLLTVFTGSSPLDTLLGALLGSIFAGNPVNSYVIGDALLSEGVSLFAVTAVIITWVNVGLVQLPAEMSALGTRFAVTRTITAFAVSLVIAFLTALLVGTPA